MAVMEINGKKLTLDNFLKKKLDNVKYIMNKDWDCVFLIDGMEGSGKSTLSFSCGWYVSDGKMTINNVCEGTGDAVKKLEKLPDKSVLIIDEGSLMFSSKEVMRKEQKRLVKILQVIRQKMMCLIIVAPSFFELNKYIAVDRSRFLLHVYTDKKLTRGRFCFFSEKRKKLLYAIGKKNFNSYKKPKAEFRSRFYQFDPFGDEYLELKKKSLKESFEEDKKKIAPQYQKWLQQRNILFRVAVERNWSNQSELSRILSQYGQKVSREGIRDAISNSVMAI